MISAQDWQLDYPESWYPIIHFWHFEDSSEHCRQLATLHATQFPFYGPNPNRQTVHWVGDWGHYKQLGLEQTTHAPNWAPYPVIQDVQ